MRLTAELINNSLSYINPLNERELDLRDTARNELIDTLSVFQGHKIPAIENLGVVAKDHECIDFTDNDITSISNFPQSPRLQTLLLARNRISSIGLGTGKTLPNLRTLVLSQNFVAELADLDPLAEFKKLTHVTLVENPVASKENYRYYLLWRCPTIRFLDFQKVKDAERDKAVELFGTADVPTDLAKSIMATRSKGAFHAAAGINGTAKASKTKLTEKEKRRFQALIKNAKSLPEVQKLEKAYAEGRLPLGIAADDLMDET